MDWGFILSVMVTGIAVVFLVLVILIVIVSIMGKIFESMDNSKKNKTSKELPVKPAAPAAPAPVVTEDSDGLTDDVVAAITAAISVVLSSEGEENKPFVIKSIKRVREARNAWNYAGVVENTRPF